MNSGGGIKNKCSAERCKSSEGPIWEGKLQGWNLCQTQLWCRTPPQGRRLSFWHSWQEKMQMLGTLNGGTGWAMTNIFLVLGCAGHLIFVTDRCSGCHSARTFLFTIFVSLGSDTPVKLWWDVMSDYFQSDLKRQAMTEGATSLVQMYTLISGN